MTYQRNETPEPLASDAAPPASAITDEQIDWRVVGTLIEAHMTASRYHTAGTSNWGAALYKALRRAALQPAMSGAVQPAKGKCKTDCGSDYCLVQCQNEAAAQPASSSAPAVGAVAWADMKPWMRDFLVRGGGFVRTLYNEPHDAINRTDVGAWIQTASDMLQRSQFAAPSTGQDAAQAVDGEAGSS